MYDRLRFHRRLCQSTPVVLLSNFGVCDVENKSLYLIAYGARNAQRTFGRSKEKHLSQHTRMSTLKNIRSHQQNDDKTTQRTHLRAQSKQRDAHEMHDCRFVTHAMQAKERAHCRKCTMKSSVASAFARARVPARRASVRRIATIRSNGVRRARARTTQTYDVERLLTSVPTRTCVIGNMFM